MVLLSYIGGKARITKTICDQIPNSIPKLVSPFFGAGSVEFYFANLYPEAEVCGFDIFFALVNFWTIIKHKKDKFITKVKNTLPMTKERYFAHKKSIKPTRPGLPQAVHFFAVNKCSYNGIMSASYSNDLGKLFTNTIRRLGKFTFPQNLTVHHRDFVDVIKNHPTDFLFLDPPYYDMKKIYGFSGEFSNIDHDLLFKLLQSHRGLWLLVYNDHPWVHNTYREFSILPFCSRYSAKRTGQQLLIKNY